jgi:threonine/homoserine/homoserine lactone efflux protein
VASPGIGVLFTLAADLSRGWHASVVAAFGCTLGIVPRLLAAVLGLAALLHTSALAFQLLWCSSATACLPPRSAITSFRARAC